MASFVFIIGCTAAVSASGGCPVARIKNGDPPCRRIADGEVRQKSMLTVSWVKRGDWKLMPSPNVLLVLLPMVVCRS